MDIILFHSILGLRPVEHEIAAALAEDGHRVTLPDLYDGQTVEDYDSGFVLKRSVGEEAYMARAVAALEAAPATAVLAGVSSGAFLVGEFWGNRPQMPAAVLIAGPAPWMEPRRPGFKVSAHIALPDPFDDEAFFAEWAGEADGVDLQMHRYEGGGHYFLDRGLPDYHAESAAACMTNIRGFLAGL